MADFQAAEVAAPSIPGEAPVVEAPAEAPSVTSLFGKASKGKKKKFASHVSTAAPAPEQKAERAAVPAAFAAASHGASARRAADVSMQNNCSLEALACAVAALPKRLLKLRSEADVDAALNAVLDGVAAKECPSRQNETLRQILAGGGSAGSDLAKAFSYADAVEVLETLVSAARLRPAFATRGALVGEACVLCGGGGGAVYSDVDSMVAAVSAACVLAANGAGLTAVERAVRETKEESPRSCESCGERSIRVVHRIEAQAPFLALNLAWAARPSTETVRALLDELNLPVDVAKLFPEAAASDAEMGAPQPRYLAALVCFRSDHYTVYRRSSPPSKLDEEGYQVYWTYHDRFLERGAGDWAWLKKHAAPEGGKPLEPCLAFYAPRT
ncbi:hypothetical protein M885DRAFT_513319 [Pelagophyceae sp. CCMP2097]|nr:hypothetical protein M885DRAFT_513319 [Pelagophyceae sp. CCMP2097]|mmetsp:Transcript_6396/g.22454  ORF Transcript_6396/g.22454 Transcript_6396/m.22454 type:complete len:386 (+) Transcript_6396:68-1225(+)